MRVADKKIPIQCAVNSTAMSRYTLVSYEEQRKVRNSVLVIELVICCWTRQLEESLSPKVDNKYHHRHHQVWLLQSNIESEVTHNEGDRIIKNAAAEDVQFGFRSGKGTDGSIFVERQM